MKKKILVWIALSVLIVIWIVTWSWEPESFKVLMSMDKIYFILILGVVFLEWGLSGLKVKVFAQWVWESIWLLKSIEVSLIDRFFGNVTPGGVWGQPFKVAAMRKLGISSGKATGITMMEFFIRVLFFLFCLPYVFYKLRGLYIGYINSFVFVVWLVSIVFAILIGIYFFLYNPQVIVDVCIKFLNLDFVSKFFDQEKLKSIQNSIKLEVKVFSDTIWNYLNHGLVFIVLGFFVTVLMWLVRFYIMYLIIYSFGFQVSYFQVSLFWIFVYIVAMFVPIPGGGVEITMLGLLKSVLPLSIVWLVIAGWKLFTYGGYVLVGWLLVLKVFYLQDLPVFNKKSLE